MDWSIDWLIDYACIWDMSCLNDLNVLYIRNVDDFRHLMR